MTVKQGPGRLITLTECPVLIRSIFLISLVKSEIGKSTHLANTPNTPLFKEVSQVGLSLSWILFERKHILG